MGVTVKKRHRAVGVMDMISVQYQGSRLDLSMTDREFAQDVWEMPFRSLLGYYRDTSVTPIDHPYHLLAVRVGVWTVVVEVTGVNPVYHTEDTTALRMQRAKERGAALRSHGVFGRRG
jgi:hypothetical protein